MYDKTVMWIGPGGTHSPLHYDPNDNFMHQIDGEKHLLLVDPVESVNLYSDHSRKAAGNTPIDPTKVCMPPQLPGGVKSASRPGCGCMRCGTVDRLRPAAPLEGAHLPRRLVHVHADAHESM